MPVCMWPSHKTFTQPTWLHLNHKTNQPATDHKETSPQTLPQRVHERERERVRVSESTNTNTVYVVWGHKREEEREKIQSPGKVAQLHGICAISYTCPSFLSITCGFYINLHTGTYSTHMHDNTTGVSGKIYKEDITRIMQQPNCFLVTLLQGWPTCVLITKCTCVQVTHALHAIAYRCSDMKGIIPID